MLTVVTFISPPQETLLLPTPISGWGTQSNMSPIWAHPQATCPLLFLNLLASVCSSSRSTSQLLHSFEQLHSHSVSPYQQSLTPTRHAGPLPPRTPHTWELELVLSQAAFPRLSPTQCPSRSFLSQSMPLGDMPAHYGPLLLAGSRLQAGPHWLCVPAHLSCPLPGP